MSVRYRTAGGVARVELDRPPLNILDIATSRALEKALRQTASDKSVRVVVLSGRGKCFSVGADVADHTKARVRAMLRAFHGAVRTLYHLPKPTVAAVHGHCLGGGWELAQACDLVCASPGSRFGQPEILLGCYSPAAAVMLPEQAGGMRAAEIVLLGETYSVAEARAMGLVSKYPAAYVVKRMLSESGAALACAKMALRTSTAAGFEKALKASERIYFDRLARTRDMDEGVRAFMGKRKAVWRHA